VRRTDPLGVAAGLAIGIMTSLVWWSAVFVGGKPRAIAIGTLLAIPAAFGIFRVVEETKHGRRF